MVSALVKAETDQHRTGRLRNEYIPTLNTTTRAENAGKLPRVPYLYLKKPDRVSDLMLITKTKLYGIIKPILPWFTSYLKSRNQVVQANGFTSHQIRNQRRNPRQCVATHGFVPPDRCFNRTLTVHFGRHLRAAHARSVLRFY